MNKKVLNDNYVEISGIFLENGILNLFYEIKIKEKEKIENDKNKDNNEEFKEKIKELKEIIIQNKKYNIDNQNLINIFFEMDKNKKPKIEDLEKLEKYLTNKESKDILRVKSILNNKYENDLDLREKRRIRSWANHRIKSIYKKIIEREMKRFNISIKDIKKEKYKNNKLDKRKKKTRITEFTSKFRIDSYERISKYKYENNPIYINLIAYDNLANYLYRKQLIGKRARIKGRLINYYNNDNKYIGNFVEINKIRIKE